MAARDIYYSEPQSLCYVNKRLKFQLNKWLYYKHKAGFGRLYNLPIYHHCSSSAAVASFLETV